MSEAFNSSWLSSDAEGERRRWLRRMRWKRRWWNMTVDFAEALKRGVDVVGGACALVVFSPIFIGTALAIKLEDRGPVFYRQTRVGKNGKLFGMWKFRSMVVNADAIKDKLLQQNQHGGAGVTFKMKDDPRITKVGKWIRKLSLDEFPQFYNVLIGDMSLVGPRPPVPREVAQYRALHLRRLRVRPGITCIWQISGRSEIDFEGQVRLDLEYIQAEGLLKDLWILVKTVPAVVLGKGAY
jgi:exopolysaccharide biosynthesis polyprenyl glycosylphosphotransferase